jgi:hypothetical protein
MAKGAVITSQFVEALGLGSALYTLTRPMENKHHEVLLEPMFHIEVEGLPETVYLERQYLFDNQFAIKPSYGVGEQILLWTRRAVRYRNNDPKLAEARPLLASDLFMLKDPREFLRFRMFLKSKRILDSQARDFLARNHERFGDLAANQAGLEQVFDCLGAISEWPDPENGFRKRRDDDSTLEGLAKTFSQALLAVRGTKGLVPALLARDPETRLNVFQLLCFTEDPNGAESLMIFLRDLGTASRVDSIILKTSKISSGPDLSRALESLRSFLSLPVV